MNPPEWAEVNGKITPYLHELIYEGSAKPRGFPSWILRSEYPVGETPQLSTTFINQFMKVGGDSPVDFRPLGWVHSSDKSWWGKMVGFVLAELGGLLDQVGLYQAVRAVQYGIPQSSHNFYGILEHYNPLTGTFFTPVGEMGLALHELIVSMQW